MDLRRSFSVASNWRYVRPTSDRKNLTVLRVEMLRINKRITSDYVISLPQTKWFSISQAMIKNWMPQFIPWNDDTCVTCYISISIECWLSWSSKMTWWKFHFLVDRSGRDLLIRTRGMTPSGRGTLSSWRWSNEPETKVKWRCLDRLVHKNKPKSSSTSCCR